MQAVSWEDAYEAIPKFYQTPYGEAFGSCTFIEDTDTILMKSLQGYADGVPIRK